MAAAVVSRRRAHVVMPQELIEEVDELVGPRRRSRFVQEAVEEKLRRLRRIRAYDDFADSLADADIPGWETSESTIEWVRAQRRGWSEASTEPPATGS